MKPGKSYRPFIGEELKNIVGMKVTSKKYKIDYLITDSNYIGNQINLDKTVWIPSSDLLNRYNFTNNKICGKELKHEYQKEIMV